MLGPRIHRALEDRAVNAIGGRGIYTGRGLYLGGQTTEGNNLIEGQGHDPARMATISDETAGVTILHKEYIQDVYAPGIQGGSAVPFQNSAFYINPGLQSTFPWLSQIAQNYEEYQFEQLIFEFKSTTTDIGTSTTGQTGTVIMSTNYNAANQPFSDKQSMVEYAHSETAKVTDNMIHGVECDPMKSVGDLQRYIRTQPVKGEDIKTYDMGIFQLAIANCPNSYNGYPVGELWVHYKVRCYKPKLFVSRGLEIDIDQFVTTVNSSTGTTNAPTQNFIFGQTYGTFNAGTTAYTLDNASYWLSNQLNNIGVLRINLNPGAGNNLIAFVFPAYISGDYEIKIMSVCTGNWNAGTPSTLQIQGLIPTVYGNILRINDIPDVYNGSTAKLVCFKSGGILGGEAQTSNLEYIAHLRVRSATNGLNNVVTIQFVNSQTQTTQVQTYISITQYNTQNQTMTQSGVDLYATETFINSTGTVIAP